MKTLSKLLFALSLLIILNSCSKNDNPSPEDSLEGTWTAVGMEVNFQISSSFGNNTINSENKIVGSNLDYDLVFTDATFSAIGSYDLTSTTNIKTSELPTTISYANQQTSGTFTNNESTILVDRPFFKVEVDGIGAIEPGDAQSIKYEINDNDELIFTQNEVVTIEDSGVTTTITAVSTSKWLRQ